MGDSHHGDTDRASLSVCLSVSRLGGRYSAGRRPSPENLWGGRGKDDFDRIFSQQTRDIIAAVVDIADQTGTKPTRAAINWVLSCPELMAAVIGPSRLETLEDNVVATGWRLGEIDRARLDRVSEYRTSLMT